MAVDSKRIRLAGNDDWRTKHSYRVQEKWDTLAIFKEDKLVLMKFNDLENEDINDKEKNESETYKYFTDNFLYSNSINENNSFDIIHKLRNEFWELAAQGEKETPLQKYYRLKFETEELLQELSSQKKDTKDCNEQMCTNIEIQLHNILTKLSDKNYFTQLKDFKASDILNIQNYVTYLSNCKLNKTNKIRFMCNVNSNDINKEILLRSTRSGSDQHLQIFQLEERLRKLEKIIGYDKLTLKRLIGCDSDNLIEAICLLRKLSKLYLPQVDSIDSQVHKLLPKLEKIAIKLGYTNLEVEENVNELLQIVLKAKEKSNVIPDVLKRMALLENISKKIEKFATKMNILNDQCSENYKHFEYNEILLKKIEKDIPKSIENVIASLKSLNGRIEGFADRLKIVVS